MTASEAVAADDLDLELNERTQPGEQTTHTQTTHTQTTEPAVDDDVSAPQGEAQQADDDSDDEASDDEASDDDGDAAGDDDAQVATDPFADVPTALRRALERRGFAQLTPVQQAVLNADDGRRDLRISSQTGSGKTVALGFALAERLLVDPAAGERPAGPTTLIVAPTRELAGQVCAELAWLFADIPGMRCEVVTGGTNIAGERMRLSRRPAVLVGTPGRLLDHVTNGALDLSSISQVVLDEADQMLDLGFKDELDGILAAMPEERRAHLVSATFPRAVEELADRFQKHALRIEGTELGAAHADIEHVAHILASPKDRYRALVNLLLYNGDERALVFVRTREDASTVADKLAADGFAALPIHGDLAQAQRTRTLEAFRRGAVRALVATDVAARGLDIADVGMVVHTAPPLDSATYVHRSGRTGRAGQKGRSVMLVPAPRRGRVIQLYRQAGVEVRWQPIPTLRDVSARQLARAEAKAIEAIEAAGESDRGQRKIAARLLADRDPLEVVAAMLVQSSVGARKPFPFDSQEPIEPKRHPFDKRPTRSDGPDRERRGRPDRQDRTGRSDRLDRLDRPDRPVRGFGRPVGDDASVGRPTFHGAPGVAGFTRFSINWGWRAGAEARRILAHICRRGDLRKEMVGSISLGPTSSTFEVRDDIAPDFARRVQRRDSRDPHLVIDRANGRPQRRQ